MQIFKKSILFLLYIYKKIISPVLRPACRFFPTCSDYAKDVIQNEGVFKGGKLALKRLLKCHPWGPSGIDLPPKSPF